MNAADDGGRLQAFSDAVFALAATLLVVTLEVPSDYDALLEAFGGFPAFALGFASIVSLWLVHRDFFARYPISDVWTVTINGVLLFVVLLYVYPLKLLAEVVSERFLWVTPDVTADMARSEVQGLYMVFGAAVVAVCAAMGGLYLRAWLLRDDLGLDPVGRFELVSGGLSFLGLAAIAVLSIVVAALGLGLGWGLPVVLLVVLPPVLEMTRARLADQRRPRVA